MNSKNAVADNLKETIKKIERFVWFAFISATVFFVLSLTKLDVVELELWGFPLRLGQPLALAALYLVYVFSCLVADNLIRHFRDLANKLDSDQIAAVFGTPSLLIVSPIVRFAGTVIPGILIGTGVWNVQKFYPMHYIVWWFAFGFGLILSILVYVLVSMIIAPYLNDSNNSKHNKA